MIFTFDDLFTTSGSFACNGPTWTDEQIQLAKDLIAKIKPDISTYFNDEEICFCIKNDNVSFCHDYLGEKNQILFLPWGGEYDGKILDFDENNIGSIYTGQVFEGYTLEICGSVLNFSYKTIEEIVPAALIALETLEALEFQNSLEKEQLTI